LPQFPIGYRFPQDTHGISDKSFNYGPSAGAAGAFNIINPSTGKVLGLAGAGCDDPMLEVQEHDPNNTRQRFTLHSTGRFQSVGCVQRCITPKTSPNQCDGGSPLRIWYMGVANNQQWKIGVDGRIALDVDCSPYQRNDLVITAIEDGNIENWETVFFSFVNPASNMAMTVDVAGCGYSSNIYVRKYDVNSPYQKFKLSKVDDKYRIETSW
jgi:hypothetical protein